MGIKGLSKLLQEHAPGSISEHTIANYFGRKVAIDASMVIYQFLVRSARATHLQSACAHTPVLLC